MSSSLPDLDWERSPAHLAFLRTFLEPRVAIDPSTAIEWQQWLGEEPRQAIRRLLEAGTLEYDDLTPHLTRSRTVAQLREALRERGLPVSGRKEELIARLLQADAHSMWEVVADEVLLRCSDRGRQVLGCYQEQEGKAAVAQEVGPAEEEGMLMAGPESLPGQEAAAPRKPSVWLDLNAKARAAWEWVQALAIKLWLWLRKAGGALAEKVRQLELGARLRAAWGWVRALACRAWKWLQRTVRSVVGRLQTAAAQRALERRLAEPSAASAEAIETEQTQGGTEGTLVGASLAPGVLQPGVASTDTERQMAPETERPGLDSAALEGEQGQLIASDWMVQGARNLAAREYRQAVDDFSRAIDADPRLAGAYGGRASALAHLGEWEGAIADYERAIELEPQSAAMYHDRGVAYERMGDYQQALDSYRQAISIDARLAGAHCGCGTAYRWLNDAPRALESYSKAIELNPRLAGAYSGTGDVYYVLEDYARAITEYDRAIRLDGKYTEAYHNRGLAYEHLGDYRRAAADYRMVRELAQDPDLREWVEERLQKVLVKLW